MKLQAKTETAEAYQLISYLPGKDFGTDLLLTAPHPFGSFCFNDYNKSAILSGGITSLPQVLSVLHGFLFILVK